MKALSKLHGILLLAALGLAQTAHGVAREAVYSPEGMVASRSRLASEVGARILAQGGNAIDAAVATGFALAVTYPSAGNLAGGGFMVIRLADGTVITNDHRERAPAKATRDMYLDAEGKVVPGRSTASHLAVGVPGTVDGLLAVLERYGTMTRGQVIAPALRLASKGFLLDLDLARDFARQLPAMQQYPASVAVFSRDGKPYAVGEVFRQPDLANTLKRISDKGRDGFYAGETAGLLVAEMARGGGLITHQDLTDYRSVWREPVTGSYRGYQIISMPPPSSGGVLLIQMLNMLEPYDLKGMGYGSSGAVHLLVEAERRAYADRAEHLGDPDFFKVPVARLIDKSYAKQRFADFVPGRASRSADIGAGSWPAESHDTTHASFMDRMGNAVALTTTLNLSYGSKIVAAGTGMLLNNEMDDFSAKPDTPNAFGLLGRDANAIEPGKRMLSSMTPTLVVKDGRTVLATGSPGGSTIITTTLQVIVNVIDHGMDLSDAVSSARFHHQWQPDAVIYEPGALSPDTLANLRAIGHQGLNPWRYGRGIGDANSVMRTDDGFLGMADPRNAGAAVGP
ncbi:MAG: gamma-glutamyltransferase [Pseudomonadales bacterium]